jgi:hypothetical protein
MNDIVQSGGRELVEHQGLSDSMARLELLKQAMLDPNVQPDKAVAMADLMFKLEDRECEKRFIAAKGAAIAAMPRIFKDGKNLNTGAAYAKWETMQPIITPVLTRQGLALSFEINDEAGKVAVTPILSGHGWQERGGRMVFPSDAGAGRNAVQAVASSASYGKRHTAMAMLNLVQSAVMSEDDDGFAAGGGELDAYAELSPDLRELVDKGRAKAAEGAAAYGEWFKTLDTAQRGHLAFNTAWPSRETWHAQNKELAEKVG